MTTFPTSSREASMDSEQISPDQSPTPPPVHQSQINACLKPATRYKFGFRDQTPSLPPSTRLAPPLLPSPVWSAVPCADQRCGAEEVNDLSFKKQKVAGCFLRHFLCRARARGTKNA
ncbi:uncharacterized protein LOC144289861 isoform X2 [Canis aureus]